MFYLDKCPDNFIPYKESEGRYPKGADESNKSGTIGGSNETFIEIKHLPPHEFFTFSEVSYHEPVLGYVSEYTYSASKATIRMDGAEIPLNRVANEYTIHGTKKNPPNVGPTNTIGEGVPVKNEPSFFSVLFCEYVGRDGELSGI